MNTIKLPAWRSLVTAGASALVVASIGLVSSSAAEPAAAPANSASAAHDGMVRPMVQHLQAHLDRLAERLEIKASQEDAWQKFSTAFAQTWLGDGRLEHGTADSEAAGAADAASLARRHAEHAQHTAQRLTQLADATAALEAVLSVDQRRVFDGAARHFAAEHGHMEHFAHAGHGFGGDERSPEHCSAHGMGDDSAYRDPHQGMVESHRPAMGGHSMGGPSMGSPSGDDAAEAAKPQ